MEGNYSVMAVYRRHAYLCRGLVKKKSRDGGNHHDSR